MTKCRVPLTGGNIRNSHIYLRNCSEVVPADGIGGKNMRNPGTPFEVTFSPGDTVHTDVDGSKMIFRCRTPVREFFEQTNAEEGDVVLIERTGDRSLRVTLE